MSTAHSLAIVVAATSKNGIGVGGGLPWKLPGEMKYFARVTSGDPSSSPSAGSSTSAAGMNTVIMGRKTWESIPPKFRPLKGRRNLVISRGMKGEELGDAAHSSVHNSLEAAVTSLPSPDPSSSAKTFLIGGAQLYDQALLSDPLLQSSDPANVSTSSHPSPTVTKILLTRVLRPSFDDCDVFLPDFASFEVAGEGAKGKKIWKQASHRELTEYVGFEVKEGEIEEKGVTYRFEMWERDV